MICVRRFVEPPGGCSSCCGVGGKGVRRGGGVHYAGSGGMRWVLLAPEGVQRGSGRLIILVELFGFVGCAGRRGCNEVGVSGMGGMMPYLRRMVRGRRVVCRWYGTHVYEGRAKIYYYDRKPRA